MLPPLSLEQAIEKTLREEWGRILASLTKTLGDIQLAEDSLQDAVESALHHWPKEGLPKSAAAWLLQTARRKAIDRIRRTQNFAAKAPEIAYLNELAASDLTKAGEEEEERIEDKRLEMLFTCCHPSLEEKTQIALTLRTLGGLTTGEIAKAFLDNHSAMAKRLTRAKNKIRVAKIPYKIPDKTQLPERLKTVLGVIYLIFNEGYNASSGDAMVRTGLSNEAIRLARILQLIMPEETEISGLLALMLLNDSRRAARLNSKGEMVALEDQNRGRWDQGKIKEGQALVKEALSKQRLGPYQIQAAISALHAEAPAWAQTDWPQISALYRVLQQLAPSPVVSINAAVAQSYGESPEIALEQLEAMADLPSVENYPPYHLAKSDILMRCGNDQEALRALERGIALSENRANRDFLQTKLARLQKAAQSSLPT